MIARTLPPMFDGPIDSQWLHLWRPNKSISGALPPKPPRPGSIGTASAKPYALVTKVAAQRMPHEPGADELTRADRSAVVISRHLSVHGQVVKKGFLEP